MKFTTHEIAAITQSTWLSLPQTRELHQISTDSRKLFAPASSIFIAIAGKNHDAHRYLKEVYDRGVRAFIVEKNIDISELPDAVVLQSASSLRALQSIAAAHRSQYSFPVVGITGSNGKTIVKEWLNQMLADDYTIVRSPKSYNSQIGVALSVLNIESNHSLGIFEAGISEPGEMARLEPMILPSIGIFINVGSAHRENFVSAQQLANEKAALFAHTDVVLCSADYPEILQSLSGKRIRTWSLKGEGDLRVERIDAMGSVTRIAAQWLNQPISFEVPFHDLASIENAMACVLLMLHLGYDQSRIQHGLSRLNAVPMRLELLAGVGQSVLVNDTYSSDIHSLEIAADFTLQQSPGRKHVAILSDIFQSGLEAEEWITRIHEMLEQKGFDEVIAIGPVLYEHQSLFSIKASFYRHVDAFLEEASAEDFQRKVVLIKGARDFRFERIVQFLQEQTHDTVLEIDLNAMAHNLHFFRSKLKPGVKVMAMVKAYGYGSGSHEVASLLQFNKTDYLAVAYTDEGIGLRQSGISLPIVVMNPEKSSLNTLIQHHLEPEIYSMRTLDNFIAALRMAEVTDAYPIHLKLDTGMRRLGFVAEDLDALIVRLKEVSEVRIASVFTHLAASDESAHDDFTRLQLERFQQWSNKIEQSFGYPILRHAGNTGAIQRFPEAQFDMVRLGVGLYGVSAIADEQMLLQSVSSLRTVISQIKTVEVGESVGYGRSFIAEAKMRTATIPIGYADGLRRSLSNGVGAVSINGVLCPIVGRVCMDMTMVDVSHVDCKEGDSVEIFGKHISLNTFAKQCGTIAYEVLTSVPQRVKRVYLQD